MTINTYPKSLVEASTDLPTISVTRDFTGSVEQLMRAFTDPELFARWIGPGAPGQTVIDQWDARRGGNWRYVYTDDDGAEYGFYGSFHDITADRLVQTMTFEPMAEAVLLETLRFEPIEGRTRLHTISLFDSLESRDGMLNSGMEDGMDAGFAKLDALLQGQQ